MPTVRWIEGDDVFGRWSDSWQDLVAESINATPFQTFEWQSTWFRHFGGAKKPMALAAFEGADLVGWYPVVLGSGAWKTVRPMGKGPSDYLHPLYRRGVSGVGSAMAHALLERTEALIDLHQVREDFAGDFATALDAADGKVIEQAHCLVLELPASYEAYLQGLGKSLRYDVRRLEKPPFSDGTARIQSADANSITESLDNLFKLHAMRWRKRWQPGAFPAPLRRFHLEWARLAESKGWLELTVLHDEMQPIGALYAMVLNGSTYYYQAGMDPSKNSISPGTLLVASAIRRAIERGDTDFDFLRGDEAYKRRWKPQVSRTNRRYLVAANTGRPAAGLSWNLKASDIEAKIRTRLEAR